MFITQMTKMLVLYNVDTETVTRNEHSQTSLKQMKKEQLSSGIENTKKKQMINLEQKKYNCRISESETRPLEITQSE